MDQKQASTMIIGLAIALAVLAGVIMTVATISQQADATAGNPGSCIKFWRNILGFSGRVAAQQCTPAGG